MRKHNLREWMIAIRPWSFPASAIPVIVTLAMLFYLGREIDWAIGVWALLNMILFQAAGNVWSDYFDFKHGVDSHDTYGSKTLTGGVFNSTELFRFGLILLICAILSGLAIFAITYLSYGGMPILIIGAIGTFLALFYPFLKYNAFGDLDIFLCYAVLPTLGTSYVATGAIVIDVLWVALPVGLITVAILHANNSRDTETDRRAHICTFAMVIGKKSSIYLYCAEIMFPFGWVVGCVASGFFPIWTLIVLPVAVPAFQNLKRVSRFFNEGAAVISDLDIRTAKLQLMFGLLFSISFFLSGLL